LALQSASDRGDELARKEVRLPAATFHFRCDLDGFVRLDWLRGLRLFGVKWLGDEVDDRRRRLRRRTCSRARSKVVIFGMAGRIACASREGQGNWRGRAHGVDMRRGVPSAPVAVGLELSSCRIS